MFSLYSPTVVLMVVFTLQDVKRPKRKRPQKRNTTVVDRKKNKRFRRARKASNKWANEDFIVRGGIFGFLPTSILGAIGHSFSRASDRYTYIVSVPNLYHSLGRQAVSTLKEEAEREWHKA